MPRSGTRPLTKKDFETLADFLALPASRKAAVCLVILDEVVTAVTKKLLTEEDLTAALGHRNGNGVLVLTGRGAGAGLLALADTVTEMRNIKHGLKAGWKAQEGVEF